MYVRVLTYQLFPRPLEDANLSARDDCESDEVSAFLLCAQLLTSIAHGQCKLVLELMEYLPLHDKLCEDNSNIRMRTPQTHF